MQPMVQHCKCKPYMQYTRSAIKIKTNRFKNMAMQGMQIKLAFIDGLLKTYLSKAKYFFSKFLL